VIKTGDLPPTSSSALDIDPDFDELSAAEMDELTKTATGVTSFNFDQYLRNSELTGWLKKKSASSTLGIAKWTRKWFTLQECRLMYYPTEQEKFSSGKDNAPEGIISLQYATNILSSGKKSFKVVLPESTYELETEDTEERTKWIRGLLNAKTLFERLEEHTGQFQSNFGITKEDMRKEGSMDVKNNLGNWQERYLVLVDGMLLVFSSKLGMNRKSKFPLYECQMHPIIVSNDNRFGFELESSEKVNDSHKKLMVSCGDEIETQMWLNAILKQKLMIEETINLISF
jgi:hypothetical protein